LARSALLADQAWLHCLVRLGSNLWWSWFRGWRF